MIDPLLFQHAKRFERLVKEFTPPPPPKDPAGGSRPDGHGAAAMTVVARIRPLLEEDEREGLPRAIFAHRRPGDDCAVDVHELRQPVRGPPVLKSATFRADRVYDSESTTAQLYADIVQPMLPFVWDGGVGTLFAYGQTGSGKTFTVSQLQRAVAAELLSGQMPGERNVFMTIIELAGDAAHDLLNSRRSVAILEDPFGAMQLTGASEHAIATTDAMLELIDKATSFRNTASTFKNDASSRSHSICRIRIQNPADAQADEGVLYLIDLAGSEAARDMAAHDAQRLRETREINSSLSVLKDCIRGKADADAQLLAGIVKKTKPHVPFRRSTLTKVLKHVFDPAGLRACRTVVIGCVNPGLADVGPGKNTLRYVETLRVIVPPTKTQQYDPLAPTTWTNERLQKWIAGNSGTPRIDPKKLAPTETGIQLLRLPKHTFERRCRETKGVTAEQANAFYTKLWQMHVEAQQRTLSAPASASASASATGATTPAEYDVNASRSSSREVNPAAAVRPFKERIRPGMVVSWKPPAGFKWTLPGMNLAVVLCPTPAAATEDTPTGEANGEGEGTLAEANVADANGAAEASPTTYTCALVAPGVMPGAYELNLWHQTPIDVAAMDAEVILDYDAATRYYYMSV